MLSQPSRGDNMRYEHPPDLDPFFGKVDPIELHFRHEHRRDEERRRKERKRQIDLIREEREWEEEHERN